ncbi:hypothetical protein GKZ89_15825 [Bacillus mangrovi]|uniref:Uncharacterized protein n=1 Tax=Metabacillus mangrovi TaxID=1491830 RepID=A0A7X2V651_9BACI|nr:hypothetical protein [Metabacillus mangrovi]MTH54871.1 hypothetical protein [Metabacillus mangrovi]
MKTSHFLPNGLSGRYFLRLSGFSLGNRQIAASETDFLKKQAFGAK